MKIPKMLTDADYFANHMGDVPVWLVVCAELAEIHPTDIELDRPTVVYGASIYPAVQNVLLKACDEGLGIFSQSALEAGKGYQRFLLMSFCTEDDAEPQKRGRIISSKRRNVAIKTWEAPILKNGNMMLSGVELFVVWSG